MYIIIGDLFVNILALSKREEDKNRMIFGMSEVNTAEIVALRSFVFYNVVVVYLFTDLNAWISLGAAIFLELLFSLFLYMRLYSYDFFKRPLPFWIDFFVSIFMCFVAVFEFTTFEYVFDAVAFIGESKIWALFVLLFVINMSRMFLLFYNREWLMITVFVIAFIPIFISFLVLVTNEVFYADAHTVVVALNFCWITILSATIMAFIVKPLPVISSYCAYIIQMVVVIIVLSVFWHHHSNRSYSYYL